MDECISIMGSQKNPDTFRITKLNEMRVDIIHDIDKYSRCINDLLEYWLQEEASYIKGTILKDLWRHEAELHKLICDANPDLMPVPESEPKAKFWISKNIEPNTEKESHVISCPDCWWEWEDTDSCPDCWYDFKSDNKKEDA